MRILPCPSADVASRVSFGGPALATPASAAHRLAAAQDALHVGACVDDHRVGAKFLGKMLPLPFVREQSGAARWKHDGISEQDVPDEHVENGTGGNRLTTKPLSVPSASAA